MLTKLFIPATRPELVSRSHLVDQLNHGLHRKLTLISAPAGFGKTTAVTNWLHSQKGNDALLFLIGWLSLDEEDNDPVRFLTYLITALNRVPELETDIGVGALQMAQASQPPPPETILTAVINEIAMITNKIVLVMDDYHLIDSQSVHDAVTFLLENLPPQLHLVITTREDPPLQISRLRTRDQLNEFRAVHLRFSTAETAEFLNEIMGLKLSAKDIVALEKRTEGWVAGLQLAAISMQGRTDISNFIQSFTGSHHFVIDYLVEEVLNHQPEHIHDFLLQTSILDQLNGSLCDALTGQENGQVTLETLERANLFIVSLDSQRRWYRYHHLFADLLRQRLRQTQLGRISSLHRRASEWFEQYGFTDQAIEHAVRAEDFERAVYLIEDQADSVWMRGEHRKLQYWLAELPIELLFSNPNLCIFHAWEQFANGQLDAAEESLQAAETLVTSQDSLSEYDRMQIQGRVATIRAFLAFHEGNIEAIYMHSGQALEFLPEDDLIWRNNVTVALGDAYSFGGNLEAALRSRLDAWETSRALGNTYMELIASMKFAVTLRQQGKLDRAKEICEQQLLLAGENGLSRTAEAGWILAVWGEILAEQDMLEDALQKTPEGSKLAEGGDKVILSWCNFCLIRVLYACGDIAGAETVIKNMEYLAVNHAFPPWIMKMIAVWQVRLWLAQDKLEEASQWLSNSGLDVTKELENLHDVEYLALARILIARGQAAAALDLLQQIYRVTEESGHISKAIELLNLEALALQASGDTADAVAVLERALSLAESGGFLRIFVDEGPPMARLLYDALSRGIAPDYVQRLLAAFPVEKPDQLPRTLIQTQGSEWIEPLTDRELEVLQLIAEGLSRQEIASQLVLSLNTVKTHARNIFSKLGVNNQMQAAGKARVLGLLDNE